ncbi:phosphonate C-P lyase system protein PhnH [Roseibium sp. RKSG952]|uniref:phosphonate C-P lyase system protein PhnH n=1 Tax=Roseibium sp. RKSG952 TaxID=2529384 RepID=UPI0012BD0189|nr:phosphonate C-P lyase system protein PhnH [Roseibium sp. RKSG952]MTH98183.1 phosphonate C-P lyase system protein PhnH [Roseibium sp. RKSG952]
MDTGPASRMADHPDLSALAPGFPDPVHDAQRCFRAVMMAMARPGGTQDFNPSGLTPPAPLTPIGAALALTLFDYDTTIWLDKTLSASQPVSDFLKFHTGARLVTEPADATFALIADPASMPPLNAFHRGSPDYPDRSATLILLNQLFAGPPDAVLTGPGVKDQERFATQPVPAGFWHQVQANNAQFPRGVDLVFAGSHKIAALPRSTTITLPEA